MNSRQTEASVRLQEKRTRAPSRQPPQIEQLHCDGFG